MQISDLTGTETGQYAHLTVNGRTYSGVLKHIRSHHFPGTDGRLTGSGTPPPDRWTIDIHLDTVAFDGLSPETEIEVLDRLPAQLPANGNHFPTEALERLASSTITAHASGHESTVKLADGRTGTYYFEPAPSGGTWILRRR